MDNRDLRVHLPFGVYLGGISIATIANSTAVLVYADWEGLGMGVLIKFRPYQRLSPISFFFTPIYFSFILPK